MKGVSEFKGIYLHREPIDMRKAINGLCQIVEESLMGELMGTNLFVFCNRRRDLMKVLYFDRSGFAMWVKRLERDKFPWPRRSEERVVSITTEQFSWLLDGYDVWKMKPFEKLYFARVS
jgi:transposase